MLVLALAAVHAGFWVVLLTNLAYLWRQRPGPVGEPPPLVSVLIPARNEAANLPRLLASLWAQDYPAFEVVVYDDGSTDATPDVLAAETDPRLVRLRGEGPPAGWVGKVHALYQATRVATGARYLFLDADAELRHPGALRALVARHAGLPAPAVLTGMPRYNESGGLLLVSLVATSVAVGLPWALVPRVRLRPLAAMNGQCWLLGAADYHAHEPHLAHRNEVLEDVEIGRTLRAAGVVPYLARLHGDVSVRMYGSFGEAWAGFRKNAYLILGGHPASFALVWPFYVLALVVAPFVSPWLFASTVLLKVLADRAFGLPPWIGLVAPLSFGLGGAMALDSALAHARGRVEWKGRRVA